MAVAAHAQRADVVADTSALVCVLRGDHAVKTRLHTHRLAVAFATFAELETGVLRATHPVAARRRVEEVLQGAVRLETNPRTAEIYARVIFELEQCGRRIPINDIWIAACALEAGLPLVARDEHFARIAGLHVITC